MLEMKEVLVNFFMSLREAFIEEVSEAILETIQENLPHNKNGLIPLSGRLIISLYYYHYLSLLPLQLLLLLLTPLLLVLLLDFRDFLLAKDSSFSDVAQEARLSLKLTSLGSDR